MEFFNGAKFVSVLVTVQGNVFKGNNSLDFSGSGVSVEDWSLVGVHDDEFVGIDQQDFPVEVFLNGVGGSVLVSHRDEDFLLDSNLASVSTVAHVGLAS